MYELEYPGSLHGHSEFSNLRLRDCIIKLEDYIWGAAKLGHEVIAITDHESISGHVKAEKIYEKVKKEYPNFKLIRGNEIYLCRNGLNANNFVAGQDKYYHFILLARDAIGHEQIREISTRAWTRSYMARGMRRVPTYYQDLFEVIGSNPGHVIASTACLGGALGTQLLLEKEDNSGFLMEKIRMWCRQLQELFGEENFFLEMQPSHNKEQIYVNRKLLELSKELQIPYIITTDTHYLRPEDRAIHKAYLNAQNGDREVDDFYATTYMMTTEEIREYMCLSEDELQTAFQNILNIKNMCEDYTLQKSLKIPRLPWKELTNQYISQEYWGSLIPYLNTFWNSDYEGDKQLANIICVRLQNDSRLQTKEVYDAIEECLQMTWISSEVNKTHWSAYYLNLQKIIEECWKAGTLVGPGRGSGVGFILLYLLDITQINPVWETTRTFAWRFLNPARVSVLDVDIDIEGGRRSQVLKHLREVYGENRVSNVATFGTEKAKSAILTAARGLGIDVDIAQYLASMVQADRGQQRSLSQTFYGDEENGFSPSNQFVMEMTENYPELWKVAQKIEGLVCRLGEHAGGVIFVDEPFTKSTALMRAPNGDIITAYDLHDCEDCSLIKYDLLSVEALDKMHICLDLLVEQNYVEQRKTLKETYDSVLGIYNIERNDMEMWKKVWNHEIQALFQMEQQSGIQGIALVHPQSVDDLAVLNSVIRLMAQEKGAEQPLEKFARFKGNIQFWYDEMLRYGLSDEEMTILEPVLKTSYGICESQEKFMQLVQIPECGGFDLNFADKLRKAIAKKNPAAYEELQKEYFEKVEEKDLSKNLCNYVWNVLVATSRGYGFNASHTLAYSLIALQEMNLAHKFPIIFWNCACLISDSGGAEREEDEDEIYEEDVREVSMSESDAYSMEDFGAETTEEDSDEDDDVDIVSTTKKKTTKSANYGKIATAIGKMRMSGIDVAPPDINKSTFTFSPDPTKNIIRYGMSGITRIGEDLIKNIIANRPYTTWQDFLNKVKLTKPQMVNLIKCGAFDELCGDRVEVMKNYIRFVSEPKKRVTLQNMKMLIDFKLLPEELGFECKVYNFNKYLKKTKSSIYYQFDDISFAFYEANFNLDNIINLDGEFFIKQTVWDAIYSKKMDKVRNYIKANSFELLNAINERLYQDLWDKYCSGSISKWEMDSVSYYSHEHELSRVNNTRYGFSDFYDLYEEPEVDYTFRTKDGKVVPMFRLHRVIGTVLDKDKAKKTLSLLTPSGVVTVKMFGPIFTNYDKQISEKGADGKKHVIEKSFFERGNKIIICGIRRGDAFVAKKYSRTPFRLVEKIDRVYEDGTIETSCRET